jgi:Leucine-rich repeat (LRR) protein
LKIPFKDNLKELDIYNNVLSDIFNEQQNLVHLNINGNKKTILFTNTETNQKLKYK